MPCPFCDYIVLVPNALTGLLIHPAPTTQKEGYTTVPQRKVIYPGYLIEPVWTVRVPLFWRAELIMLLQMNDYLSTLQAFTLLFADGALFYTDNIKIIKNGGGKHQAYQLLEDR